MGFSTNVTISNDFWHQIAADPRKLVEAIAAAMNDGTDSPLGETLDYKSDNPHRLDYRFFLQYQVAPQGVTVHRAQHNDTPQVIINTYGSRAIAAHELPQAIEGGWFELNKFNADHAEKIAKELHGLAARIRKAAKATKT